ncbi:hypothetical protein AC579_8615 [Pseudocercospora musae]|uniref:Major facilitator superfamily (MFS) profile domain-containing protein n=1 Tax=Pseudocercospora musae TaxID=113226 RepID=A0A139I1A5_9PEZI|nr:hypothetical protein AC579_8615 [Pseudocercospora musae]KXT08500.1 hypothetical protein AC579_8615 [Pseudocercospora musae]KXT08501.1 hypothetical protein AC579_8615 [Pseudocercospora musae]
MSGTVEEKHATSVVEIMNEKEPGLVHMRVVKGSEAFHEAQLKEPATIFHPTTLRLIGCLLLGCFCQTMNGFDGSLFGGLSANTRFLDFFGGTVDGEWQAINSAMYQIGGVCALPFVGPAIDTWGRKVGMSIGAWLIIVGTIINGTTLFTADDGQLKGGRFLLGFGVSIVSAAGPIYVVETAHPSWRGIVTAYCNTFWFTGSILAAGAVRGGLNLAGNISWLIPVYMQLIFPGLITLFVVFIPESPRWLFVNNKREKAINILTKWHGLGNPESVWVKLQVAEYEEYLDTNGADKRFWDYSALFATRSGRYRILCNCVFSIFAQWAGNGVLSYFLPAVLNTAGYTGSIEQANINLGYACFQFAFALTGAAFVERIGRRPLMLFSMTGCCIVWIGVTAATGVFNETGQTNDAAAKATVACIFIFGAVYSVGLTPLQALYPVEVLSFEGRAKGMAFSSLAVNAGGLLNQFAWPISLHDIGWKTYIVFIVWCAVQATVFYFLLPETKGRTLEELDKIFEAGRPVKESLKRQKLAVANDGTVLAAECV